MGQRSRPDAHGGHALGQPPNTYGGPVSNDPLTIRFKQTIDASEPLRTGAYSKTFTLSTTAP